MVINNYIHCLIVTVTIFSSFAISSYGHMSEFNNCSPGQEELVFEVVRLIGKCFTEYNRLITLIGEMRDELVKNIYKLDVDTAIVKMSTKVPLIDKTYTFAKQSLLLYAEEYFYRFDYKAQGFLLAASSQPILRRQIRELKNSRWWTSRGLFFIIDDGTTINSCKNAKEFLWLTWRSNILSSVFLCYDKNNSLLMYSFNPYNTMAPKSWLKDGQLWGQDGHPWTLFKRNTSEDPEDWTEIFFDKTKTLENYKIRSSSILTGRGLRVIDHTKAGHEGYGGEDGEMMKSIFRFLNASMENTVLPGNTPWGSVDQNGSNHGGLFREITDRKVDITLNVRYMVRIWKLGMTYPHISTGLCFIVKSRGNVPKWMNLVFIYDTETMLGLIIMTLLTTAVLIYYTGVSAGCLNSLRIIISASLVRLPSQLPARIFLIHVVLIFVISNGIFQGRLIALLTKPRAYHNPETQMELGSAGYTIVSYEPFQYHIRDPTLRSNFIPSREESCVDRITNGEYMIACIEDCNTGYEYSKNSTELHIVSERFRPFYMVFSTTLDWPLSDRFDQIIQRLSEAGFAFHWRAKNILLDCITCHGELKSREEDQTSILALEDLVFIFNWLLSGLFFASLVFSYEVLSVWYRKLGPGVGTRRG